MTHSQACFVPSLPTYTYNQCDPKKITKCLEKLPKSDFTRKMPKLPKNVGDLGKSIVAEGFKKMPKVQ